MDIANAQAEISKANVRGAPGVFVSGAVWLAAGLLRLFYSDEIAFAALFFGGMLIVPLSSLIGKLVFGAEKGAAGNPLERLGFEGTIVLFAGLFLAFVLLQVAPDLAFPALALMIGARYFAFRTIYREPVYWALGAILMAIAGAALLGTVLSSAMVLLFVGAAECLFAALLLWREKRVQSEA